MKARERAETGITLSDKRLLSVEEFAIYASIGIVKAREIAAASGSTFRVGSRYLVDRVKFDRWCDEHNEA